MCGRTACALAPDCLQSSCRYQANGVVYKPQWIYAQGPDHFSPSYNFCPTNVAPILACESHFDNEKTPIKETAKVDSKTEPGTNRIAFHEMKWGLISSWQKSPSSLTAYKMINARAESLTEKQTFRKLLNDGHRCVFVVEGFYEWQERKGGKQPYFIYMPQKEKKIWEDVKCDVKSEDSPFNQIFGDYNGRQLMFLAGLFDKNTHVAEYPVYTFTVITVNASDTVSFIHDRMPAILPNEQAVLDWTDHQRVPVSRAMKLLAPYSDMEFHPVSTAVNNVSFKEHKCIEPMVEKTIASFFKSKSSNSTDAPPVKKEKVEQNN